MAITVTLFQKLLSLQEKTIHEFITYTPLVIYLIFFVFSYLSYQNGIGGGNTAVSLDGLRKPKIDSWDSMGILGLTTKIWNDTKKRQETFLESTGHFLREETSSYIM